MEGTGWRRSRYDRLTAADAANLISESPAAPMHVALVGMLDDAPATVDGGLDLDRIRAAVAARLPALPRFRQVVFAPGFGCGCRAAALSATGWSPTRGRGSRRAGSR